jgi:hypothetical protein
MDVDMDADDMGMDVSPASQTAPVASAPSAESMNAESPNDDDGY